MIGVDCTCWSNERGYGRFAREMVAAMVRLSPADEFLCFVDDASIARFSIVAPNADTVLVKTSAPASIAASASGYRSPRDMLSMTLAVTRARPDVFFSPSVYTYFPLPPGLRAVVTVHDAIAERFPQLTLPSARARAFWTLKLRLALFQARRVLTVSDYAASDVARVHGIAPARIDVATEAASTTFRPRSLTEIATAAAAAGVPEGAPYFIYVGGFNPHKNIPSIIRAHAEVVERLPTRKPHLVLAGTLDRDVFHGDLAGTLSTIERAGTTTLVHWPGFVPDEQLSALNSGAIALLLPSAAEGFGLPAVEAAACGSPVIATRESPLPQLLEGGGLFVSPGDEAELGLAMYRLASEPRLRERLAQCALERSRALTWEKGALAVLRSLRMAAG